MIAKHEIWKYSDTEKVWAGKYKNSHNLLHWHYDCELLYVEHGKIDVFCERVRHTLTDGQALFVDSGQVHYMRAQDPETVLVVIIFDYNLIKSFTGEVCLASSLLSSDYGIPDVYAKLRKELKEKKFFYDASAACEITKLMIDIFRGEKLVSRPEIGSTIQSFKALLGQINEKFEFYSFEDAASFMGMSPAYFSRYFHSAAGMTFSQYLNYVKVDNAVHLLRTDKSLQITEIAIRCGFSTIRNFNRTFKDLTGFPPKRLPADFSFDDKFSARGTESFNPTLTDCELIEHPHSKK